MAISAIVLYVSFLRESVSCGCQVAKNLRTLQISQVIRYLGKHGHLYQKLLILGSSPMVNFSESKKAIPLRVTFK